MSSQIASINSTTVRSNRSRSLNWTIAAAVRLAPRFTSRWLQARFLQTRRYPWPKEEQIWIETAQTTTMYTAGMPIDEWDGLRFSVYRWGTGTRGKVVLQHGWNGRATQMHGFIGPLVAAGYQVIAADVPGHGHAQGRHSSLLHFSNVLTRIIRNEGPVEAVIAHSLGGGATIHALTSSSLPVKRIALVAPSADIGAFARYMADKVGLDLHWLKWIQHQMEARLGTTWDELNALRRAPHIRIPAFVIHDKGDREVSLSTGLAISNAMPKSSLQMTDGLGHNRILKDADVIDCIVKFVAI